MTTPLPGQNIGKPTHCAHCGDPLPRNERRWIEVSERGGVVVYCKLVCHMDALKKHRSQADEGEEWKQGGSQGSDGAFDAD